MVFGPNPSLPPTNPDRFSHTPLVDTPRSSFDLSHRHITALNSGDIVPIMVDEVYPGDTWQVGIKGFGRMPALIHPYMDHINHSTWCFFVPMRLVWQNTEKFFGERDNPTDSIDFQIPTISNKTAAQNPVGGIYDYMGIPAGQALNTEAVDGSGVRINALYFRA